MKTLYSSPISAFGGINFVFDYLNKLKIDKLYQEHLPCFAAQSKYSQKDIFYSFNSIFLCGGDCIEDLQTHLKSHFINNPFVRLTKKQLISFLTHQKTRTLPKTKKHPNFYEVKKGKPFIGISN